MTYTTFNDESGETSERINQFKKWFWSVLEKFNSIERQDLVRKNRKSKIDFNIKYFLDLFLDG